MNILKAFLTAFIAVAALISPTTSILAATLINIGGMTETSQNSSVDTNEESDDEDTDSNEGINTSGSVNLDTNDEDSNNEDEDEDLEVSSTASFTVNRNDIGDSAQSTKINSHLSSSVVTEEDLKIFAETTIRNDENIEEIEFDEDEISITYSDQGKFLGFLPINLDVEAVINKEGEVDVDYPWYSFLVTGSEKTNIEAALRSEVEDMDWVENKNESEVVWSPSDRAMIAAQIQAILQSYIGKKSSNNNEVDSRTSVTATSTVSATTTVE